MLAPEAVVTSFVRCGGKCVVRHGGAIPRASGDVAGVGSLHERDDLVGPNSKRFEVLS